MKYIISVFFFLFFCCCNSHTPFNECSVHREDVIVLAATYFDVNNDELLSKKELEHAWNRLLYWYERIATMTPWVESASDIINHCDADGDEKLSLKDYYETRDHCLNSCEKVQFILGKLKPRIEKYWFDSVDKTEQKYYSMKTHWVQNRIDEFKHEYRITTFDYFPPENLET